MGRLDLEGPEGLKIAGDYIKQWGPRFFILYTEAGELILRPTVTSKGIDSVIVSNIKRDEAIKFGNEVGLIVLTIKKFWWKEDIGERREE